MAKRLFYVNLRIKLIYKKHIIADRIGYIGKETKNINKAQITAIEEDDYIEYENFIEFHDLTLSLKPMDLRD